MSWLRLSVQETGQIQWRKGLPNHWLRRTQRTAPLTQDVSQWHLKPRDVEVYSECMAMDLPLKDMTLHEKLVAMELLWEDLTRSPESVESPAWHKDILDERRGRVAEGKARFADWEKAKKNIRSKIS